MEFIPLVPLSAKSIEEGIEWNFVFVFVSKSWEKLRELREPREKWKYKGKGRRKRKGARGGNKGKGKRKEK